MMVKYYGYVIGQWLANRIPRPLFYRIVGCCSLPYYYFRLPYKRRAVNRNLRMVVPAAVNVSGLAKQTFANFGKFLVDFVWMKQNLNRDYIRDYVKISGLERLEALIKAGEGGVIVTAHVGNWELLAGMLNLLGAPVFGLSAYQPHQRLNDFFAQQREAWGNTVVYPDEAVPRFLEQLKRGGFVLMTVDRNFSDKGQVLNFLGHRISFPKGAAVLARKKRVAILPAFLVWEADDNYRLMFEEPIWPPVKPNLANKEAEIVSMMKQYLKVVENQIRQYPTQWFLTEDFFQNSSAGEEESTIKSF